MSIRRAVAVIGFLSVVFQASSGQIAPGWGEMQGVHVGADQTVKQTDPVMVDREAAMYKTGSGTLEVPMENVNRAKPYALTALAGTMKVTAGEDATVDLANPPAVLQDAAFWIDTDSVVLDGANRVTKWCDVRDTTRDSTTYWYAYPAWSSGATDYKDVPPLKTTYHGKDAIYFYGRTSCLHMNFAKNDVDETVGNVKHVFLVHGVQNCWGAALGYTTSREGGFTPDLDGFIRSISDCRFWFSDRGEFVSDLMGARFYLNGVTFDPFTCKPNRGRQMLEVDYLNKRSQFNRLFWCGAETFAESSQQGGDYISEVVLFTNLLTSAQRSDVERYLLKKWNLPYAADSWETSASYGPSAALRSPSGTLEAVAGATVEIAADADEYTGPYVLAGRGTVEKTGEGTMWIGPTEDEMPFAGTFELKAGAVLSAGGRPPAMTAEAGKTYSATAFCSGGSRPAWKGPTLEQARKGGHLLKVETGAAGTATKTGGADVRFDRIADGVKTLDVTGGEVQLDSRPGDSVPDRFEALGEDVSVSVLNNSFEDPYDTSVSAGRYQFNGTLNGWSYGWIEGSHTLPAYVTATKGWNNWADDLPVGSQALAIVTRSAATTKITIPKAGSYTIDFLAAARHGYVEYTGLPDYHKAQVVVVELHDGTSWKTVGSVMPYVRRFTRFRLRMEGLKAQEYTLRLVSPYDPYDGQATVDDVHVCYDPTVPETGVFKVPDGDFEYLQGNSTTKFMGFFTVMDAVRGWTFSITNQAYATSGLTNLAVGVTGPGKYLRDIERYCVPLFRFGSAKDGGNQLAFVGGAGLAETTFTLPAGTWKLRCEAARVTTHVRLNGDKNVGSGFKPRAVLRRANETTDLGVFTAPKSTLSTCFFPDTITLAEPETVTLALAVTGDGQCGVLDNLVFVPVSQIDDAAELVKNGSFEAGSNGCEGWTTWSDRTHYTLSAVGVFSYGYTPASFGHFVLDGINKGYLKNKAAFSQTVAVPEKGLYRLRLHAMTRTDAWSCARENIRITFTSAATSEETEVDRLMLPNMVDNWFEREYLVKFDAAGDYTLKFEGGFDLANIEGTDGEERTSMLDAISLKKVNYELEDAPEIPEQMDINVGTGSRLVLNYPGEISVRRLYLGGNRIPTGTVVRAADYPEFLGGIGTINVAGSGKGMTVIVR